jgi:hypothetical protein
MTASGEFLQMGDSREFVSRETRAMDAGEDHEDAQYARMRTRSVVMRSTQEVNLISTG